MSDDNTQFVAWLRQTAADAGFDPQVRGSIAALAAAADLDPGQLSRVLGGKAFPAPATLRALATALRVPMVTMCVQAGILSLEDLMDVAMRGRASVDARSFIEDRARELGVPEESVELYAGLLGRIERAVADQLKASTD